MFVGSEAREQVTGCLAMVRCALGGWPRTAQLQCLLLAAGYHPLLLTLIGKWHTVVSSAGSLCLKSTWPGHALA